MPELTLRMVANQPLLGRLISSYKARLFSSRSVPYSRYQLMLVSIVPLLGKSRQNLHSDSDSGSVTSCLPCPSCFCHPWLTHPAGQPSWSRGLYMVTNLHQRYYQLMRTLSKRCGWTLIWNKLTLTLLSLRSQFIVNAKIRISCNLFLPFCFPFRFP